MKKKIKDLTYDEYKKMCEKHPPTCKGCPLGWMGYCLWFRDCLQAHEIEKALEQEIEVEDNE